MTTEVKSTSAALTIAQPRSGLSGVIQAAELVEQVRAGKIAVIEAKGLLDKIIEKVATDQPETFAYSSPLGSTAPGCGPSFNRSFQHVDWIDGESVVQAEQTPGEDGFNRRFHRIESDFDALGTDVDKAFDCLAALRAKTATLLGEIEDEFNHVHQLLAQKVTPTTDAQTLDGKDSSEFSLAGHNHDGRYLQLIEEDSQFYTPGQTRMVATLSEPPDHVGFAYSVALANDLPSNRSYVRGPRTNEINVWIDKSGSGDDKEYRVSVQNASSFRLWIRIALFVE